MNCMKCGRDIPQGQVFCDSCLEVMKKYPVKPDAAIQLPRRSLQNAVKKQPARRRPLSPEEQIPLLKRSIRRLKITVAVLVLLLVAAIVVGVLHLRNHDALPELPNYTNTAPDTTGES